MLTYRRHRNVQEMEIEKPEAHAVCGECSADLTAAKGWRFGPVIHCTAPGPPHHGRRRWICSFCRRDLGCNTCRGSKRTQIFCAHCQVYIDGPRAVKFTAAELGLLFALALHATAARATPRAHLAAELRISESEADALIQSLKLKEVAIGKVGEPPRFWLDADVADARFDPPRPVGIELRLPFSDR